MIVVNIEPFEHYMGKYEEWFENNAFVYESELQAGGGTTPQKRRRYGDWHRDRAFCGSLRDHDRG